MFANATTACQKVDNDYPTIDASGRVDGRMFALRVIGAITRAGQIRLDADYRGRNIFSLSGANERALLVYAYDEGLEGYVLARTDEILDAIIGLRLTGTDLLMLLTGCVTPETAVDSAQRFGELLAVRAGGRTVYLRQREGLWRVVGGDLSGLRVDYPTHQDAWPAQVVLAADPEGTSSVRLRVRRHDINRSDVNPETFAITPPVNARQMTLADLRARFRQQ